MALFCLLLSLRIRRSCLFGCWTRARRVNWVRKGFGWAFAANGLLTYLLFNCLTCLIRIYFLQSAFVLDIVSRRGNGGASGKDSKLQIKSNSFVPDQPSPISPTSSDIGRGNRKVILSNSKLSRLLEYMMQGCMYVCMYVFKQSSERTP